MIPKYEVKVDWDATHWAATPDFSEDYDDISTDVAMPAWRRGKQKEEGNAPAATLELRLVPGTHKKYSPFTTGVLAGKVRPWLPVRVRVLINGDYVPEFFGFISRISITAFKEERYVNLYCTDGIDLLARQKITQDPRKKTICSDGEAMEKILDAAGWSKIRRKIDKDGGDDLLAYPSCHPY